MSNAAAALAADENRGLRRGGSQGWTPTAEQEDVFAEVKARASHLLIEATAGSGKTSTIIEATKVVPRGERICFLAFNKSIQTELRDRLPRADCFTFHALGLRILRQYIPDKAERFDVEGEKNSQIIRDYLWSFYRDFIKKNRSGLLRLVSLAKGNLLKPGQDIDHALVALLTESDIAFDITDLKQLLDCVRLIMHRGLTMAREHGIIDYDDMLYLPAIMQLEFPKYDRVFVDEAQDLNSAQRLFVRSLLAPEGKVVAVGDRHQAIYAFRGADHGSITMLQDDFGMKQLPLYTSFRCCKAVVEEAKKVVEHIKAADSAPEGEVRHVAEDDFNVLSLEDGDMLVCRNNGPLFELGMIMLQARRPFTISSNLAKALNDLIDRLREELYPDKEDVASFIEALRRHTDELVRLAEEAGMDQLIETYEDNEMALLALARDADTVSEVKLNLQRLLAWDEGPHFSSIHQAKGTEAEHVVLYRRELLPSSHATTAAALQQEDNLLYVAVTRAKLRLTIVYRDKLPEINGSAVEHKDNEREIGDGNGEGDEWDGNGVTDW